MAKKCINKRWSGVEDEKNLIWGFTKKIDFFLFYLIFFLGRGGGGHEKLMHWG